MLTAPFLSYSLPGTYARTVTRELRKWCFRCWCCGVRDAPQTRVVGSACALPPSSSLMGPPKSAGISENDFSSEVRENRENLGEHRLGQPSLVLGSDRGGGGRQLQQYQLESYVFLACAGHAGKHKNIHKTAGLQTTFARRLTPPHVASGRGNTERFEKYLLI